MNGKSGIEWTDTTWNPTTGCDKVSPGCKHCYAETLSARLKAMGSARYEHGFRFTVHDDKVEEPLRWRKPRRIFVNSMSDLFHEGTPLDFLRVVFDVIGRASQHQYQILTKRPARMADCLERLAAEGVYRPTPSVWVGTSVESDQFLDRVDHLRRVPATVRFLSCEPLLGPLDGLDLTGIHWVIAGGESGVHLWNERLRARRALVDYIDGTWTPRDSRRGWVHAIRDACTRSGVAFFFKQWGGHTPKAGGRHLEGRTWDEFPTVPSTADRGPERLRQSA